MASSRDPSFGRPATIVRSSEAGRRPAAATRPTTSPRKTVLSTPAGVDGPAGKMRPRSPRPAAPSSASQTACSATSPSEWPWSRGAPSTWTPPRTSGVPGPNGWLSWPIPVRGRPPAPWSAVAARARSPGSVTLMLPGSPSMTWTGMLQASSSAASSVNTSGPSAGYRSNAARRTDRRTPWGVCAVANADRSTVASTKPAEIRLTVSPIGTTGMAAPWTAAVVAIPSINSGETIGRAPSCTNDASSIVGCAVQAIELGEAGGDRSLAAIRAGDHRDHLGGSHGASRMASTRSGDVTTTSRATTGAMASASSVHASNGRPAIGAASLSTPPILTEAPAATTIASAVLAAASGPTSVQPGLAEDHPPGDGLQDARDGHVEILVDMPRAPSMTIIVPSSRKPTPGRPPCPPG